jgi:DNA-binding IclR family transcriptional regulator
MDGPEPDPDGRIPTNLRLLTVLEVMAEAGVPMTPTAVNERLGLPKPTIHRLFATLEGEGFVQRDIDGRSYSPGRRLRVMSSHVLSSLRIRSARHAVLRRLSEKVGETCNIALPGVDAMIYIERVETQWPLRIQLPIGTRVPFHCTASGKVYLASLRPIHRSRLLGARPLEARTANTLTDPGALDAALAVVARDGHATDREEFMDGMVALAVPIPDPTGRLVSTLSFHAPTQRFLLEDAMRFLPALRRAAAELASLVDDGGDADGSAQGPGSD